MNSHRILLIGAALLLTCGHARSEQAKQTTVFLWPDKVKEFEGKPTEKVFINKKQKKNDDTLRLSPIYSPSITVFPAPPSDKPTPAIVICPGGGYQILAINTTGTDIAEWCNTIGVTGIVLKYSVPNKKDEALQDIQRAMGFIRQNAKAWNINPDQLGVMGFSAGAHLTMRLMNDHAKRT
jgi:acetyl esterase/lipase